MKDARVSVLFICHFSCVICDMGMAKYPCITKYFQHDNELKMAKVVCWWNDKYNQSNEQKKDYSLGLEKCHSRSAITQFKVHQCSPLDIILECGFLKRMWSIRTPLCAQRQKNRDDGVFVPFFFSSIELNSICFCVLPLPMKNSKLAIVMQIIFIGDEWWKKKKERSLFVFQLDTLCKTTSRNKWNRTTKNGNKYVWN